MRNTAQQPQEALPVRELQPETLKCILDSVGVVLAVIDHEGRVAFSNQAALNMLGVTENLSVSEWRRGHKVQDSRGHEIRDEQAFVLRALAGQEVKPTDVRVTLPDGRIKWIHGAAFPFSVLGLTGVVVICADETEQVELRTRMERAQRMEAFGVLAGGLVHDFKNILTVLSGNIALGLSDEGVLEITRNRFQEMAAALDKGTALVVRLMQYIRKQPFQIRPVQVNEVANAVLDVMRPLLTNRVRVKVELSERLPVVQADSTQIEQVLVNLILNALDAMPDGGKLMLCTELTLADGVQEKMNEERSAFVLITVADTGTGIPEHLQSTIFEPFFTTKPGKGVGLGLSSAQLIVKRHLGRIEVQSTPGVGTKFSIYLPVQD